MDDLDKPECVYAPPRKPILVIDLQPYQLKLPPEQLELAGEHAASQVNQRIQEVHWRIGNVIVAKTQVTNRLPPPTPQYVKEQEKRAVGRPQGRKDTLPGEFDSQGRFKPWFV